MTQAQTKLIQIQGQKALDDQGNLYVLYSIPGFDNEVPVVHALKAHLSIIDPPDEPSVLVRFDDSGTRVLDQLGYLYEIRGSAHADNEIPHLTLWRVQLNVMG